MSSFLPTIEFHNERFDAQVLLQGAQLLSFAPHGHKPWIFDNPNTPYEAQKEIYGGVPLVFPWFNLLKGHEDDAPNHGFARQAGWKVESQDNSRVTLALTSEDVEEQGLTSPYWNFPFAARMIFEFGESLGMRFEVENRGSEPFQFECALHPYFAVSDVRQTRVEGGDSGSIGFPPFGSTVLESSSGPFRLIEPERTFVVSGREGWRSSIVWNPGEAMEDVTESGWPLFVCVEPGVIRGDAVSLAPGESYALDVTVEVV